MALETSIPDLALSTGCSIASCAACRRSRSFGGHGPPASCPHRRSSGRDIMRSISDMRAW